MTMTRDFLSGNPADPGDLSGAERDQLLMHQQTNYLAEIANYLRRQNADVLTSAVVRGASQLSNGIADNKCHEIVFEVGGKPVEVYQVLIFSTWDGTIAVSPLSMATIRDGIQLAATDVYNFNIPTSSIWAMTADSVSVSVPLIVNGPAGAGGGLFVYGYTIPDWDRIRESIRR